MAQPAGGGLSSKVYLACVEPPESATEILGAFADPLDAQACVEKHADDLAFGRARPLPGTNLWTPVEIEVDAAGLTARRRRLAHAYPTSYCVLEMEVQ